MLDYIADKIARKTAHNLHLPYIEAHLEVEMTRDGKSLLHKRQRSKSFVRNAYNILFSQAAAAEADDTTFGPGLINAKDVAGTIAKRDTPISWIPHDVSSLGNGFRGNEGISNHGIVLGLGTGAESLEDYYLSGSVIANGNGSGQLNYNPTETLIKVWSAGTRTLSNSIKRYFNNNSGGQIDGWGEIILIGKVNFAYSYGTLSGWYYDAYSVVFSRDLLPSPINIPDKAQIKIVYTISLVYPS
ncbi:hypothetical protein B1772_01100 [Dehalococcoides mccartyi]|jgi:hypothetical protein|uniref:hypothetical protein n=1 Tax=Dehalococcoides mccartyi TaxID=61435 RepID=UPI0009A52B36|nr:hypothetical protein [Dehalococcoides mccartyi]AQY72698.1 hypothetical protein B1772_01100 [Dehalococcoides mccartyi]MDD5038381.1 hypothetical protein [Dehalococcoidales bacterium]